MFIPDWLHHDLVLGSGIFSAIIQAWKIITEFLETRKTRKKGLKGGRRNKRKL
jgi:hypothetical protein